MQGRNGDVDVGNGPVDTVSQGESGTNGESSINTYTLSAGEKLLCNTGSPVWCSEMTQRSGVREGEEGLREGGNRFPWWLRR